MSAQPEISVNGRSLTVDDADDDAFVRADSIALYGEHVSFAQLPLWRVRDFLPGAKRVVAAEMFSEIRRGFQLRAPVSDDELPQLRMSRLLGSCCEPLLRSGDVVYCDPRLEPAENDLIIFEWNSAVLAHARENPGSVDPRYRDCIGLQMACKLLVRPHGTEWWLLAQDRITRLADHKLRGVVRRVERNGERLYEPVGCGMIAQNAATQILTAQDSGPDTFNPAATGDGYLTLSGSGIDGASVLNGSLVIDAQIVDPVSTLANIALQVTWSGGSESTPSAQPQHAGRRSYSFQNSFTTLPPNTAWTMRVALSGNASITVQRASLRAEVIKR